MSERKQDKEKTNREKTARGQSKREQEEMQERERKGEYLRTMSKADLIDFYVNFILATGEKTSKISSLVSRDVDSLRQSPLLRDEKELTPLVLGLELSRLAGGEGGETDGATTRKVVLIDDMDEFKSHMPLFPSASLQTSKL